MPTDSKTLEDFGKPRFIWDNFFFSKKIFRAASDHTNSSRPL